MKKKLLSIIVAVLVLSLFLAGCGGNKKPGASEGTESGESASPTETETEKQKESQTETKPESEAKESTVPPTETEKETEPETETETETEPAGPVELNQVIYDANSIRITAVSAENRLADLEQLKERDPAYVLGLHIERTGTEKTSLNLISFSVNGFRYVNGSSFLVGETEEEMEGFVYNSHMPFLKEADKADPLVWMTKSCAEYLGMQSVGEIGLVLEIIREDGVRCYESVKVDLDEEAEPCCHISFGESGSLGDYGYVEVNNPAESVMLVECLVSAFDSDGTPLYNEGIDYLAGDVIKQESIIRSFYIRNGAEALPVSLLCSNNRIIDAAGEFVRNIGSVKIEYISAIPAETKDLTDLISYEMEGRLENSRNFMIFRCTWPEEYLRLHVCGTCFVYTEDGALYKVIPVDDYLLRDKDYRTWSSAANKETGALDCIAIDCKKEGAGGDFRFDLYLYYAAVDEQ